MMPSEAMPGLRAATEACPQFLSSVQALRTFWLCCCSAIEQGRLQEALSLLNACTVMLCEKSSWCVQMAV